MGSGWVRPSGLGYVSEGKMEEETKLAMIAETEQNANIIFEEFKGTVMEMNPSSPLSPWQPACSFVT